MTTEPNVKEIHFSPGRYYAGRLAVWEEAVKTAVARYDRAANLRLGVFAVALGTLAAALWGGWFHWGWTVLPAGGYAWLCVWHAGILRAQRQAEAKAAYYREGLDRVNDRWRGKGRSGSEWRPEDHLYADDLDLFGEGSLFERLNTANTVEGGRALASWLCAPAPREEVLERQAAIRELRSMDAFRAKAFLTRAASTPNGRETSLDARRLEAWGARPSVLTAGWPRTLARALAGLNLTCLGAALLWSELLVFLVWLLVINWGLLRYMRGSILDAVAGLDREAAELATLAAQVRHFETQPFRAPWLRRRQDILRPGGAPVTAHIHRLHALLYRYEAPNNVLFAIFGLLVLWRIHAAYAIEAWRREHGGQLAGWVQALGTLDAASALGAYAFERPDHVFPILRADGAAIEIVEGGHPLLPPATCVRNTVRLGPDTRILIVSGSNMSGKSTLLRAVGVNTVLALMGSPVCARGMTLSPAQIGATIRIQDSIQRGMSRFSAEVDRLSRIFEAARQGPPLLFLFDEILHGTNSHDRQAGAKALAARLLELNAIGLLTTHDLALTALADAFPSVTNVHFQDHVEDGELQFDYKMRPGVVRKSNALALMRRAGLDV